MNKEIIQQLSQEMQEVFVKSFEEIITAEDYTEFNKQYVARALPILCKALGKFYEYLNEYLKESEWRKKKGYIVKDNVKKRILTSLGFIDYKKTIYIDKKGKTTCLLDDYVGIKAKEQMMDDARERIICEVIDNSYRKSGLVASILDGVHKQTVKNLIMTTKVPEEKEETENKKEVEVLYIEADEDHVSLQEKFKKKKRRVDKNGRKIKEKNTIIDKLVYCFEGKELEAPKSQRKRLINPHYFAGIYRGSKENQKLWEEVYKYIDSKYNLDKIKKIYINGDGASWIKEGVNYFKQAEFVMDEFHILKYARAATTILKDSQDEGVYKIYKSIREKNIAELENIFATLREMCKTENEKEQIKTCYIYFVSNFDSICLRLQKNEEILGCSAEGHVSHILSNRLSSRPMGWSYKGCDNISKLIAYHYNGGNIAKLFARKRERVLNYNIINFKEAKKECIKKSRQEFKFKKVAGVDEKYYNIIQARLTTEGKILNQIGQI